MKIIIPGIPKSQMRHRHCKVGQFIRVYDPSSKDKAEVKNYVVEQLESELLKNSPIFSLESILYVDITFYMPIQKSVSKSKRMVLLNTDHICKPDLDNLAKFYLDMMSGIVFHDDNHIASLNLKKVYSDDPKTEIEIKQINQ